MKIYIDSSVYLGYDDDEFKLEVRRLFRKINTGWFEVCYSSIVEIELKSPLGKRMYKKYAEKGIFLHITPRVRELSLMYLERKVLPITSEYDAIHIALATFYNVEYLVSLDSKHIVNDRRIHKINEINLEMGYKLLRVLTPKNIL